jgi:hypothetical protein
LYNRQFYNFFLLATNYVIKPRRIRRVGHVAPMGERTDNMDFVGIPERRRQPGRAWLRWKDNIQTDITEIKCYPMGQINLAQDKDK